MIKRIACATATAAALTVGTFGPAGLASAAPVSANSPATATTAVQPYINRVTCGTRTDWLRISSNATTCWANPGLVNVRLYNVYEWCGGNNSGYLRTTTYGIQHFKKHHCYLLPAGRTTTVTRVVIYA